MKSMLISYEVREREFSAVCGCISCHIASTFSHLDAQDHNSDVSCDDSIETIKYESDDDMHFTGDNHGDIELDNIFDPAPGDDALSDNLYMPLIELFSKNVAKQSEVIGVMAELCTQMEMKKQQVGTITQDWRVQSYTSCYFSKCQHTVSAQGSQERDLNVIQRGAIVLLHDSMEEYYCVLALYANHYKEQVWLADANKMHKKEVQASCLLCENAL